jgi:hypothetical protein
MHTPFSFSALCLGFLSLGTLFSSAQTNPEIVIRQGDTIEWAAIPNAPHKVRFGGTGGATSFDTVKDLLDFDPPLMPDQTGIADSPQKASGTLLKATVKDGDGLVGKTFVFICGVHGGQMLSYMFKIEPKGADGPRNYRILGEASINWHLQIDTTP